MEWKKIKQEYLKPFEFESDKKDKKIEFRRKYREDRNKLSSISIKNNAQQIKRDARFLP